MGTLNSTLYVSFGIEVSSLCRGRVILLFAHKRGLFTA